MQAFVRATLGDDYPLLQAMVDHSAVPLNVLLVPEYLATLAVG